MNAVEIKLSTNELSDLLELLVVAMQTAKHSPNKEALLLKLQGVAVRALKGHVPPAPAPGWVAVGDAMPEPGTWVITAWVDSHDGKTRMKPGMALMVKETFCVGIGDAPTHWHPLPPLPPAPAQREERT